MNPRWRLTPAVVFGGHVELAGPFVEDEPNTKLSCQIARPRAGRF